MSAIILKLKCITNLHVGNGEVNYTIIDNEVEKDPVTGYPIINASGVKGALREYFNRNNELSKFVNDIFGSDEQGNNTPGKLKFLQANMLTIPVRASSGENAYYMVSTKEALDKYVEYCKIFFNKDIQYYEKPVEKEISVEGIDLHKKTLIPIENEDIYLLDDEELREISLPVIARNKLDNGISKNLWYEEIVPHKTVLYFPVIANSLDNNLLEQFKKSVNGQVIQFGANASIGYGLCMVTVVEG